MADVTLLRKLTKKSTLKFWDFHHPHRTVEEWIRIDRWTLIKAYYHLEAITFSDDVLDELGITYRIPKPGVDKSYNYAHLVPNKVRAGRRRALREASKEASKENLKKLLVFNRGREQRRNHGHK